MIRRARNFAAALLLPTSVLALPVSEYQTQKGDTRDLHIAGSSAQDNTLERLFRLMCAPGSLDI